MLRYIIILLALCALLGGCADPLVYYTPIIKEDNEGLIKFQLAESMINFNFAKTTAGILTDDIVISSVPLPYGEQKFGIVGTRIWQNWGVETTVSATFRGDTDLIQQLSVSVADQRLQAFQSLASIAGVIGGLMSLPSGQQAIALPKGISVSAFLSKMPSGCNAPRGRDGPISCSDLQLDGTRDFIADIAVSQRPIDALSATLMSKPFYSSNFYYSACRYMTISLKPRPDLKKQPISASLSIADPAYVESIRIPAKGNIVVSPSCGASSSALDPSVPTAVDYLNALATQAKAIKESLEGSNSSGAHK
jgi:hypothetical protein